MELECFVRKAELECFVRKANIVTHEQNYFEHERQQCNMNSFQSV